MQANRRQSPSPTREFSATTSRDSGELQSQLLTTKGKCATLLGLPHVAARGTDGLSPLLLHTADAAPGQQSDKAAQAKARKLRKKLNKAKQVERGPQSVVFSLIEAMKQLEADASGDLNCVYLNRASDGDFFAQDARLTEADNFKLMHSEMLHAVCDELWFATRHLPLEQQWALSYEHGALAQVLLLERGRLSDNLTLAGTIELIKEIRLAAALHTPEAVKAHTMHVLQRFPKERGLVAEQACLAQERLAPLRVGRLCDSLPKAIAVVFGGAELARRTGDPVRSRKDVELVFSQLMMSQASYTSSVVELLFTARRDATVAQHVLELGGRLVDLAMTGEEAEALETMAVALLVSMPPRALRKIVVTRDDLDWIAGHVFVLAGHLKAANDTHGATRMNLTGDPLKPFARARLLKLGKEYLASDRGNQVVGSLLRAREILANNVVERETRIEELVMLESRLQLANRQISFEGLPMDELLDTFFPRALQTAPALEAHQLEALTYGEEECGASRLDLDEADEKVPPSALATDETLDYWQARWKEFEAKHAGSRGADAASQPSEQQAPPDAPVELKRETPGSDRPGQSKYGVRQPGSKPRLAGYKHGPPSGKNESNPVTRSRMKAIVGAIAQGEKYVPETRRKARERMAARAVDVD